MSWIKIGLDVNESHVSVLVVGFRVWFGMDISKANNYERAININYQVTALQITKLKFVGKV